tara:strand:- start:3289 stop:3522 length:234 start_codon:yes stop_codon:yes gene_type:complete
MRRGRPQQPNFDRMLRQFRNKVKRSGKLEALREKEFYEKPAQKKQRLKNAARRRELRRQKEQMLKPQRGFFSKRGKL